MTKTYRTAREQLRPSEVDKIVSLLNEGGIGIIPFDTVYGLIGRAFDDYAQKRLDIMKGDRRLPYVVNYADINELTARGLEFDMVQGRFIQALLPGAVTFVINPPDFLQERFRCRAPGGLGVRVSDSPLVRQITRGLGAPLWATSANRSSEKEPFQHSDINPALLKLVDFSVDGGPTQLRSASSVLDIRAFPFIITRRGAWINRLENALLRLSGPIRILIVCTGNICRSPYAAAKLQAGLKDLTPPGAVVASAGTHSASGLPATGFMISIAAAEGLDLNAHSSQPIRVDELDDYDLILASEAAHRAFMIERNPSLDKRIHFLGEPLGITDIPDPYGSDAAAYQQAAELIAEAAAEWAKIVSHRMPPGRPSESRPPETTA